MTEWVLLGVVVLLIAANALFVAAEFALVTVDGPVLAYARGVRLLTTLTEPYQLPGAIVHLGVSIGLADLFGDAGAMACPVTWRAAAVATHRSTRSRKTGSRFRRSSWVMRSDRVSSVNANWSGGSCA